MSKEDKQFAGLQQELSKMNSRISSLVDEIHILKSEVKHFKSQVANDITILEKRANRG